MGNLQELGSPFGLQDLWAQSSFTDFEHEDRGSYLDDLGSESWKWDSAWGKLDFVEKPLPDLGHDQPALPGIGEEEFDVAYHEPLEDIGGLGSSTPSLSDGTTSQADATEEDIWAAPQLQVLEKGPPKSRTWESFYDDNFRAPQTCYISEKGPGALDTILASHSSKQGVSSSERLQAYILKSGPVLAGLVNLVMGGESIIFRYNDSNQSFESRFGSVRMSGYCPETFDSLTADMIAFANRLKTFQAFVGDVYVSNKSSRSMIAIASYLSQVLCTMQASLHQSTRKVHSVLQLQALVQEPDLLLTCLSDLASHMKNVKGDEATISTMYRFVQDLDYSSWVRPQLIMLLRHATAPWLLSLSNWIGIRSDQASHRNNELPRFIRRTAVAMKDDCGDEAADPDYEFDGASLPAFLSVAEGEAMFEVGQGLRLLRAHAPEHPVAHAKSIASQAPELEMQFSWQDVERIDGQAKVYEANVLAAIQAFDIGGRASISGRLPHAKDYPGSDDRMPSVDETPETYITNSISEMEKPLPNLLGNVVVSTCAESSHECFSGALDVKDATLFSPPISLVPSMSFDPIVSAQARLINQSTLSLLFKTHRFRSHLNLQHRYQLLGDGVFASRLSHALFDADVPSAERKKGSPRVGVSGLRLGSRESWPPASSELRLALMGILSDSYHHTQTSTSTTPHSSDLPGGLSFAIRAMSESELQQCLDPNSISALDFLRLQYRPPSPLDALISSSSLEKYDTIFKLLLRLNRMLYSVTHFSRSPRSPHITQRFKIEAHHFVSCVCSYLFENVTSIWLSFSKNLDALERRIERYEIGEHDGLKRVREMHEAMLDKMMFALLLRRRQEMVMGLLEEIFGLVLGFARREREEGGSGGGGVEEEYRRFGKKVRVFVSVCRGLSERKAFAGVGGVEGREVEGGGVGRLLLRLEMSGFYARSSG